MKFIIILDKPQMGENIGAAARVMANFGLEELRVVNPRDGWPNPVAEYMATCGKQVLDNAKLFDSLKEALADIDHSIATMGRELEKSNKKIYTPNKLKDLKGFNKVGIVFGCERVGLDNEELSLCNSIVTIPTVEKYQSMNLAQAIGVICYEINKLSHDFEIYKDFLNESEQASNLEVELMLEHLEEELTRKNFFQEINKKPKMMINIRNMFNRNMYTKQEIRTLRGIIRSLSN